MGGVGVVSALSRGDIALLEIAIPQKLRHFKMDDGVPVDVIDLPEAACSLPLTAANTARLK